MKLFKTSLFLTATVFFIAACGQTATNINVAKTPANVTTTPAQPRPSVDEATMAKELYATNCMICHKETGKGGKVTVEGKTINPEDLTKDKFKTATDDKLIGYVTNGIEDEGMPAFKDKLNAD